MNLKSLNILFNKGIQALKLSWRTSLVGAKCNSLSLEIKSIFKPNKVAKEFKKIMQSSPDEKMVQRACDIFEKETGIKMYMTSPKEAYCFQDFANVILQDIEKGNFPKEIKHIIFGHGTGTSLKQEGVEAWHVADKTQRKIFSIINEEVPKKGELVLVNCCEETPKRLRHLIPKDKPAIGNTTITDSSSTYYHPLKIALFENTPESKNINYLIKSLNCL